jgi:hypothetical protein
MSMDNFCIFALLCCNRSDQFAKNSLTALAPPSERSETCIHVVYPMLSNRLTVNTPPFQGFDPTSKTSPNAIIATFSQMPRNIYTTLYIQKKNVITRSKPVGSKAMNQMSTSPRVLPQWWAHENQSTCIQNEPYCNHYRFIRNISKAAFVFPIIPVFGRPWEKRRLTAATKAF